MKDYSFPLVFFTTISQVSVGLAILLTIRSLREGLLPGCRKAWFITGIVMAVALVAAMFHLSHPMRAYDAFNNITGAWLSREIVVALAFSVGILITFITGGNRFWAVITALLGALLILVQGFTYAAPALVAIANGFPLILYALTAWVMGAVCLPLLRKDADTSRSFRMGMVLFLGLILIAPCLWSSGGTIMQMTTFAWGTSWVYWGGVVCCILALILVSSTPRSYLLMACVAFAAVFLNRLCFFGDTVSTIVNIGKPY